MVLYKPFREEYLFIFTFHYYFKYGGIAQLGERLNGIQEVSGSIPLISTKESAIVMIADSFFVLELLRNPVSYFTTIFAEYVYCNNTHSI